jgi:hypothetical protein
MHFLHPFTFSSEVIENIASILIGVIAYYSAIFLDFIPPKRHGDIIYYPNPSRMGSVANYFGSMGRKWTSASQVLQFSKNNKYQDNINLDNFIYTPLVSKNLPFLSLKQFYNNKPINAPVVGASQNGIDLLEGVIVMGSAGGGKSQFLLNIFNQNKFNRAVVHDIKGEFIKYFYREDRDIIFNDYDTRGAIWDIFEEAKNNPVAIDLFFENFIENFMSKEFFSTAAVEVYQEHFTVVLDMPITSIEKWKIYNETINDTIAKYIASGDRTESSIAQVMKTIQRYFVFQQKRIEQGAKTFTIYDFKESFNVRLFLSNRPEVTAKLTPQYIAFMSVFTTIIANKTDKKDITLLMIDEYLTFAKGMDRKSLTILHTTLRSSGVMIVTGLQSLPTDPEIKTLVWGNNRYFIIYPVIDDNTQRAINSLVGQTIYKEKSESQNINGRVSENYKNSSADAVENIIYTTIGGANYGHITFAPTPNILYIGRNNLLKKEEIAEDFIAIYAK